MPAAYNSYNAQLFANLQRKCNTGQVVPTLSKSCVTYSDSFCLDATQRRLGTGWSVFPIRQHLPDHGRHQWQAKQHLWWHHRLWHSVITGRAWKEADGEEVLLWPSCGVRALHVSTFYILIKLFPVLPPSCHTQVAVALPQGPARSWWSKLLFSKRLWKSESHVHHVI